MLLNQLCHKLCYRLGTQASSFVRSYQHNVPQHDDGTWKSVCYYQVSSNKRYVIWANTNQKQYMALIYKFVFVKFWVFNSVNGVVGNTFTIILKGN